MLSFLFPAFTLPANAADSHPKESPWVATWGTSMMGVNSGGGLDVSGQTLRMIIHTSVGGSQVRVWLSNRYGHDSLTIREAHVAICASPDGDKGAIRPESDHALTFNGNPDVTIPPGATIVSDAAALDTPPLTDLAVSFYFPEHSMAETVHTGAQQISYAAHGDATAAANLADDSWTERSWYVVSGVDVYAPGKSAIVALGDSITDGNHSTASANRRWPDILAERLCANKITREAGVLGVVNSGISGNRVLLDGTGPNAMARFTDDVLNRSGVRYLILFHGDQ